MSKAEISKNTRGFQLIALYCFLQLVFVIYNVIVLIPMKGDLSMSSIYAQWAGNLFCLGLFLIWYYHERPQKNSVQLSWGLLILALVVLGYVLFATKGLIAQITDFKGILYIGAPLTYLLQIIAVAYFEFRLGASYSSTLLKYGAMFGGVINFVLLVFDQWTANVIFTGGDSITYYIPSSFGIWLFILFGVCCTARIEVKKLW